MTVIWKTKMDVLLIVYNKIILTAQMFLAWNQYVDYNLNLKYKYIAYQKIIVKIN
jgi:hypothetical protein